MKLAVAIVLAAFVAAASAAAVELQWRQPARIVGGSVTTIENYRYGAALLHNWRTGPTYDQACGGTILTPTSILSAAHCFFTTAGVFHNPDWWRTRVGSTWGSSGGVVHNTRSILSHPSYNRWTHDNDVAIMRTATTITYNNQVAPGSIAGTNYNLADNQQVWAIGWGAISSGGASSDQLRHVQIWTVNQAVCNARYGGVITANMLCSGWLDVGGRDQCQGDSGGPLIHNGVVVGVCSWGRGCALAQFPGVNARVSRFTTWIQANA